MKSKIICTLLFLFSICAQSQEMNGIKFLEYGDFTKTWKLVTVRYRQDSHEMRFTYANPIAWEALTKGTLPFPEGSVFAKVGFKSGVDPAFNSSIVPSGARRFQYMVKDQKKFSETDGWGYALFNSEGKRFEGDTKIVTQSCHACHKLVPERNFVFSESIEISPLVKTLRNSYKLEKNQQHLRFSTLEKKNYINNLKLLFKKHKSVQIIDGDIRTYFFGGTLDEVSPILIKNVIETNQASGFISNDQNTFKVYSLAQKKGHCQDSEYTFSVYEYRDEWSHKKMSESVFCYSKNNI